MKKKLKEKTNNKKIFFYFIIISLFLITGNANASKHIKDKSTKEIDHRRVEYNNKTFDIYINRQEKFITVHGEAEDWKEIEQIEKHFESTAPTDYRIAYDIDFSYNNRKL